VITIDMGRKEGGGCCAAFVGAGTPSNMWPEPRSTSVPINYKSSAVAEMGATVATIDTGQKEGVLYRFRGSRDNV